MGQGYWPIQKLIFTERQRHAMHERERDITVGSAIENEVDRDDDRVHEEESHEI